MKNSVYSQLVSCKSATSATSANLKKSEVNKSIQERHQAFSADKKSSTNDIKRVYADWYQVYRMQPAQKRMVMQSQVDKLDKLQAYLQPIMVAGELCQITTSEKRAAEAVAQKTSQKTGKTHYIVPVKWTVSSLEAAVKYCAKVYAGTEVTLAAKFNEIQ